MNITQLKNSIVPIFLCFLLSTTMACKSTSSTEGEVPQSLEQNEKKRKNEKELNDEEQKIYDKLSSLFTYILAEENDNEGEKKVKQLKVKAGIALVKETLKNFQDKIEDEKIASIEKQTEFLEGFALLLQPFMTLTLLSEQIQREQNEATLGGLEKNPSDYQSNALKAASVDQKMQHKMPTILLHLVELAKVANERVKLKKELEDAVKSKGNSKKKDKKVAKKKKVNSQSSAL